MSPVERHRGMGRAGGGTGSGPTKLARLLATIPTPLWALMTAAAWYVWLGGARLLAGLLLSLILRLGSHPDSDLIFFGVVYGTAGLYLMLAGFVGVRLIQKLRPPFAAWKPGLFILAATTLTDFSVNGPDLVHLSRAALMGSFVLPFVLAPVCVAVGIGLASIWNRPIRPGSTAPSASHSGPPAMR
jgi:hypothetical protein